jgi:maltose O-acetyltransferase
MDPLLVPPLGPPPGREQDLDEDPPLSRRTFSGRAGALSDEVRSLATEFEPRLLPWMATRFLPWFTFSRVRARMLAAVGCHVPPGTSVFGYVHIVGGRGCTARLSVGPGCIIGPDVTLGLDAPITLGARVSLGPRAVLYTATHALGSSSRRMHFSVLARPIVVEDGAWVGMCALIMPGVRIGRGAVVASGAVVNEDVPPNVLVGGNPARLIEELPVR